MIVKMKSVVIPIDFVSIEIGTFQLRVNGIRETTGQIIFRFYLVNAQEVHDLQDSMGNSSASGDRDLEIGKLESEVGMDQVTKASLFVDALQLIKSGTIAIGHHAVVSTYYAGEKAKTQ